MGGAIGRVPPDATAFRYRYAAGMLTLTVSAGTTTDNNWGGRMALGRPAFVEELQYAASKVAAVQVPWDGRGPEPPDYTRAWLAAARRLVTERRAQVLGDSDGVEDVQ
jgi:hypothetical protein